jgi:transposase InsO family protein
VGTRFERVLTHRGVNAAESFFWTLEWELFRLTPLATKHDARREAAQFIDCYNRARRHSACDMRSPIDYEVLLAARAVESADKPDAG